MDPAHAEITQDIAPLAQYNLEKVREIAEKIAGLCQEPVGFETLLQKLLDGYGLTMNFGQYALAGSTVRSYLAWMKDNGQISARFENNRLLWQCR